MTKEQYLKNLEIPKTPVDVVLDTDAYNEADDQFAICYLLANDDRLKTKAIYAAPFFNSNSKGPKDGMERSFNEIHKILGLCKREVPVFKGSEDYLTDESSFRESEAARDLVDRAKHYSPEKPLYVIAIAAITNIASALLMDPTIAENIVIVWLGGHSRQMVGQTTEFNMKQDIAAARVVMGSNAPFVQLPCSGVVSAFSISDLEFKHHFIGKNEVTDYLGKYAVKDFKDENQIYSRVIWDVTAVAYLLNDDYRFMLAYNVKKRMPTYDNVYSEIEEEIDMKYVYLIKRDELLRDLVEKLTNIFN